MQAFWWLRQKNAWKSYQRHDESDCNRKKYLLAEPMGLRQVPKKYSRISTVCKGTNSKHQIILWSFPRESYEFLLNVWNRWKICQGLMLWSIVKMEKASFLSKLSKWIAKNISWVHFKDKKQNKPIVKYSENCKRVYKHSISLSFKK
jgi:hypothetical protein